MVRPRPKRGERRIDAAIDHLADYGFPKSQIRRAMNDLLKLYGREGWMFLEEGQYRVVLEKLLEEQTQPQQDQKPGAATAEEASPENAEVASQSALQRQASRSPSVEPVVPLPPAAQAVPARPVTPPCNGVPLPPAAQAVPARTVTPPCHGVPLRPAAQAVPARPVMPRVPLHPAAQAVPARPVRRPCYGWISEESDTESEPEDGVLPDIPLFKRKRPSRWDVGPN